VSGSPRVGPLGDNEQPVARRFRTFDEQIGLDHSGDINIERDTTLLGAFAVHQQPASADIDIGDIEVEDLSGPQSAEDHQPSDRPVPPRPQALQQHDNLFLVQRFRQPARITDPQRRALSDTAINMSEHPAALTGRATPGFTSAWHRAGCCRVAHRPKREQPRHRSETQVHRRRRQRIEPGAVDAHHVRSGPADHAFSPARGQEPQQHIGRHR